MVLYDGLKWFSRDDNGILYLMMLTTGILMDISSGNDCYTLFLLLKWPSRNGGFFMVFPVIAW